MTPTEAARIVDKQQSGPRAYSARLSAQDGRWLEIRQVRFQAHRLRLVRRAEKAENGGYLGECRLVRS
jgi:hypothetical protein